MNRLPSSVREALIQDAKTYKLKARSWCIHDLLSLNSKYTLSSSIPKKNENTAPIFQPSKQKPIIQRDTAQTMLEDVKSRLAGQHLKCLSLMDQIKERFSCNIGPDIYEKELKTKKTCTEQRRKTKVIRALNQSVHQLKLSEYVKVAQNIKLNLAKITKLLENLEALHADTYLISHQLLANERPAFNRFEHADRNLIAATFEQIRSRHASSVETLADIVIALRESDHLDSLINPNKQEDEDLRLLPNELSIYSFLRARLSIQLLCDHYMALHKFKSSGVINVNCKFEEVLEAAITEAKVVCTQNLLIAPEVYVSLEETSGSLTIIRPWMHHVLVEVLKNAMSASVANTSSYENKKSPSPIFIYVIEHLNHHDCLIIDSGLGLSDKKLSKAFHFAETSSSRRWDRIDEQQSYASPQTVPLGGLGVGLTLSRMMMQMFGGDLFLQNKSTFENEEVKGFNTNETGCVVTLRILKDDSFLQTLY